MWALIVILAILFLIEEIIELGVNRYGNGPFVFEQKGMVWLQHVKTKIHMYFIKVRQRGE